MIFLFWLGVVTLICIAGSLLAAWIVGGRQ